MEGEGFFYVLTTLGFDLGPGLRCQIGEARLGGGQIGQRRIELRLAHGGNGGKPHSIGRQNARIWMHQNPRHAQGIGHKASMLPARAAEALQRVARHVMAALDGYFLDRIGHVVDGDAQEALGHFLRCAGWLARGLRDSFTERGELRADDIGVERFIAIWAEHRGEVIGVQLAQHHVAIGHGERPTAPVACRSGISACAFGAHLEPAIFEFADRSAARCDGVDVHHRRAHPHARHLGFKAAFVFACIVAHIR